MNKLIRAISAAGVFGCSVIAASTGHAANIEAGKAKAEACAACHGNNGVSVSDDIPNLAGQKQKYLTSQLMAFRSKGRKNALMNAIAEQLSDEDIADLAAFWNSLPGGDGKSKSALLETVNKTNVVFPADYKKSFTHYATVNMAKKKQVRKYFANPAALAAAKNGEPLPNGSMILVEAYKAKLDGNGNPVKKKDGFFEADKLAFYTAMQTEAGWGADIPQIFRNGDWNYAVFKADKSLKPGVNQAKCLACHKPLTKDSYVFSIAKLQEAAKR